MPGRVLGWPEVSSAGLNGVHIARSDSTTIFATTFLFSAPTTQTWQVGGKEAAQSGNNIPNFNNSLSHMNCRPKVGRRG